MPWKPGDTTIQERDDGACVWLKPSGGWGWRGPRETDHGGRSKRSMEAAMRAVDERWPEMDAAALGRLAEEAYEEARRRPNCTAPRWKPWREIDADERDVWCAVVRRIAAGLGVN